MATDVRIADLIAVADMRLLSVDEYLQMAKAGILDEDDRVELLDGVIITMSPINPPHAFAVDTLADRLKEELPKGFQVRVRNTVQLSARSAPQPDIAVVRALGDIYARRHPGPAEIMLIVEVSDATPDRDLRVKLPLYAAAGIADTWIADLVHRRLLVHREPVGLSYASITTHEPGDAVAPLAFPDLRIDPASLFPAEG
jgi:Uma2 family endonuclease